MINRGAAALTVDMTATSSWDYASATHVWLTIGVLDGPAVRELRELLAGLAARAGIGLTVDLTALDDQHHLTAGALLSVAARTMHDQGSTLTARNPPAVLAAVLVAVRIPVTYGQPPVGDASRIQAIQVGAARQPATAAPPARLVTGHASLQMS